MKRVGNLWPVLTSFGNLLAAAKAAAAGKRRRPDVAAFLMDLEPELLRLRHELVDGSYEPLPCVAGWEENAQGIGGRAARIQELGYESVQVRI